MVSYFEMAKAALLALKDRTGSSSAAIKKVTPHAAPRARRAARSDARTGVLPTAPQSFKVSYFETRVGYPLYTPRIAPRPRPSSSSSSPPRQRRASHRHPLSSVHRGQLPDGDLQAAPPPLGPQDRRRRGQARPGQAELQAQRGREEAAGQAEEEGRQEEGPEEEGAPSLSRSPRRAAPRRVPPGRHKP